MSSPSEAALPKEARQAHNIADDVDEVVRRVGCDVVTRRSRRNAVPECPRDLSNVADHVDEAVVVDVGRPSIEAAMHDRARAR